MTTENNINIEERLELLTMNIYLVRETGILQDMLDVHMKQVNKLRSMIQQNTDAIENNNTRYDKLVNEIVNKSKNIENVKE